MLHLILCSELGVNMSINNKAIKDAVHFLAQDSSIIILEASNAHVFIQDLSRILKISSVKIRSIVIMNLHVMDKAHQMQLYKLIMGNLDEKFILVGNVMPVAALAKICKISVMSEMEELNDKHAIVQFVKSSNMNNKEPMHDLIMRLDEEEAQKAMLALGAFFEKCLKLRKQAHVALEALIMYWHQIYGDARAGVVTYVQGLKLYWIFLGNKFFR